MSISRPLSRNLESERKAKGSRWNGEDVEKRSTDSKLPEGKKMSNKCVTHGLNEDVQGFLSEFLDVEVLAVGFIKRLSPSVEWRHENITDPSVYFVSKSGLLGLVQEKTPATGAPNRHFFHSL
ncbi:hypothetical protein NDU88_006804 [Pleurodeles waltl]|uniref:Uncharacterized protein n=1 Tax=Pleurodeles waltl TaxID=8319 RepID=A0AAV7SQQ7_PLEWA|nr:hypothetical protein NDU88_006804 [Pleurodeles waltl]